MVKRTLMSLTVDDKIKVIDEVKGRVKRKKDIVSEFSIPGNTLSTILKDKDKILKVIEEASCLPQALDNLQVLRKYIQEQLEILDEIFSALNVIENYTDRSLVQK